MSYVWLLGFLHTIGTANSIGGILPFNLCENCVAHVAKNLIMDKSLSPILHPKITSAAAQ